MSRPLRLEIRNGIYHIMHRGANRQETFLDGQDCTNFQKYLQDIEMGYGIQVMAYCLMPNHYHLLIRTPEKNLSKSMQYLNSVYTRRFNKRHGRDGALFRGRFKSIMVESEGYALQVTRYIHRNPVAAGLCGRPEDYAWTNYAGFVGQKTESPKYSSPFALQFFGLKQKQYRQYVEAGIPEKVAGFYESKRQSPVFGSKEYRKKIAGLIKKKDRQIPEQQRILSRPTIEEVKRKICREFKVSKASLSKRNRDKSRSQMLRGIAIWIARWRCGQPHRELIKHFDYRYESSLSSYLSYFQTRISSDKALKQQLELALSWF